MIQYQILQANITRTVWEIVRRIIDEILGVNWLKYFVQEHNTITRSARS